MCIVGQKIELRIRRRGVILSTEVGEYISDVVKRLRVWRVLLEGKIRVEVGRSVGGVECLEMSCSDGVLEQGGHTWCIICFARLHVTDGTLLDLRECG